MKISIIPAFEDNYFFILQGSDTTQAAVVDPGDAAPVSQYLKEHGLSLIAILVTHHHADHIGGIRALQKEFPDVEIYGSKNDSYLPFLTRKLSHLENFSLFGRSVTVYETPGHTTGHVVYACDRTPTSPIDIFCGDTLFGGGCGKLFGGTIEQLFHSIEFLRSFPDDTRLWCAHEYTEKNLWVAAQLDSTYKPTLQRLKNVEAMRARNEKTVPLNLAVEKETNPFLRFDDASLKYATNTTSDLETFTAIRTFRDKF